MSGSKVLVLGDDTRSFLAIVRSLGRRGVEVHAAPRRFTSPALKSRHIRRMHDLPAWSDGGALWLEAMRGLLDAERFDLVIPCDETTLLPIARHRDQLAPLARLAIPDDAAIHVLFDKHETRELARSVGVPVAPGRLPRADDTAGAIARDLGLPVMVKPRRSFTPDALDRRQMVVGVPSAARLEAVLPTLDPASDLLEGWVPGRGCGLSVLAHEGVILQQFQHHRVREDSSGSYYRVSAPVSAAFRVAVERMLEPIRYTGVAMFEFRVDAATGAWVLLEVNARPWGSMPLAVNAGVDFPWSWFRLLTAGERLPPMGYATPFYGRNLLPDLRAIVREAEAHPFKAMSRLGELRRLLSGRERQDVFTFDDPRPGVVEAQRFAAAVGRTLRGIVPGVAWLGALRARRSTRRALRRGGGQPQILFVCQGNIYRSAFAAAALRRAVGPGAARIASAGLQAHAPRPTPPNGLACAAALGVDLAGHRATLMTEAMAREASLIVVFDQVNATWLATRHPDIRTPVLLLGQIVGLDDITDPVDGDAALVAATFARIKAGVGVLAGLLPGRGRGG